MPGLSNARAQLGNEAAAATPPVAAVWSAGSKGIWSKHRGDVTFDQLQKFWSELPPHSRKELLKIDKQMLFERARKNFYCSRCNGLLLEVYSQIAMYGKSFLQEGGCMYPPRKAGAAENQSDEKSDDFRDPYVHPWGALVATRDGILTLLDCYTYGKSLQALQNLFDCARARERERELLYPDACGGGGRGWISQGGMASYGKGHGIRETCPLHTARLPCETLVGFWSALSDETRLSLLRMKEEDFIERLMYRFDSKRFCRDCRRNVIREFKELKELKRMRREPHCTNWFCVADTDFQYEVSNDTVHADWHQYFADSVGTYHHFEWAIGTGEGKSDILDFEDIGTSGKVQVDGLDLAGLSACFITLRAWRLDGRCTELTVKAHALKGQPCVHRRLVIGDGFVTITKGENIRRFFEHAEEAEEEEDEDPIDKDGNEMDDDGFRPQKHARSPELAREFLLDAATVIFKEQVEKAFREGTARQNAHNTFVCLALKLLEERLHVACKEIITWEKQIMLLEEEEREKREEEERKERRRMKEREKKLRRKERQKGKDRERERKNTESKSLLTVLPSTATNELSASVTDEGPCTLDSEDSFGNTGDMVVSKPDSPDVIDRYSIACVNSESTAGERKGFSTLEQSKSSRQKLRFRNSIPEIVSTWCEGCQSVSGNQGAVPHDESEKIPHHCTSMSLECMNGDHRHLKGNALKMNVRNCGPRFTEKFNFFNSRLRNRYNFHPRGLDRHEDCRSKDGQHISTTVRAGRDIKIVNRPETLYERKPFYQSGKYGPGCLMPENFVTSKGKLSVGSIQSRRGDAHYRKQVWEPMYSQKKCFRSNSDPDGASRHTSVSETQEEGGCNVVESRCEAPSILKDSGGDCPFGSSAKSVKVEAVYPYPCGESVTNSGCDEFGVGTNSLYYSGNDGGKEVDICPVISAFSMNSPCDFLTSSSSSENCSPFLSEGDSSMSSSSIHSTEYSSISDSEDASQQSEGREVPTSTENATEDCQPGGVDSKSKANRVHSSTSSNVTGFPMACFSSANFPREVPMSVAYDPDNALIGYAMASQQPFLLPMPPAFSSTEIGYHNQCPVPWTALPGNRMVSFPQPNQYIYPCPLGYSLPMYRSSDFGIPYNALQPVSGPMLCAGQLPPYQFAAKGNIVHLSQPNEQQPTFKTSGMQGSYSLEAAGDRRPLAHTSFSQLSSEVQPAAENGYLGSAAKSHSDAPSFSLFHFGGPVDLAVQCNQNEACLEEESNSFPSNSPEGQVNHNRDGKDTEVEEYSLFASGDNAIFSFLGDELLGALAGQPGTSSARFPDMGVKV